MGKISSGNLHCDTVSHVVNPTIQASLHAGIRCKDSLIWSEDPGLSYTKVTGPSLGLFRDVPLLPCVVEIKVLYYSVA